MRHDPEGGPAWERVEHVFDQLLDDFGGPDVGGSGGSEPLRVSEQRLDELCGEDAALRHEVELLLCESGYREDFFGRGLAGSLPDLLSELEGEPLGPDEEGEGVRPQSRVAGRTIDRYRLLEVLGQGGMGIVYLAERADAQFEKRVALKVIPLGLESAEKERRFRIEGRILARLEHDNIARFLDGGVTDDGYPYLAMELVEGEPIDLYCERHALRQDERILLFLEVCAAVQYAHENLVLHRDLKPGNVLVTAEGRVKLLDFGVGKILDDGDEEGGTRFQPMTPEYASPEQRENRPVSTATDIYSLGTVLRQLITGARPSDGQALATSVTHDDLQVILQKALRESPERRFRSVTEMAADLRRFMGGLPIESRPATFRYRLGRFMARHRLATASALLVSLLLVAAMVTVTWQGRMARLERDRARVAAQKAQTVADLLGELLAAADPNSPSAGQLSVLDLLESGEARIREELADQPEVSSELMTIIGYAHSSLGDNPRGASLIEEAIRARRELRPLDELALSEALRKLASILNDQGEVDRAIAQLEEGLALLSQNEALDSILAARLLRDLGRSHTIAGRLETAEQHFREALTIFERHGEDVESALTKTDLAIILGRSLRPQEALTLNREALKTLLAARGPDHPMVAATRNNIAVVLHAQGDYEEAKRLLRESIAAEEQSYGPGHPALANSLSNLGKVLMDQGHFEEAAPIVRRAAELRTGASAPDAYNRIAAEMNLAALDLALGDLDESVALYRSGLERLERLTGPSSPPSARVRGLLGIALHRAGDPTAAEELLSRALEAQAEGVPPVHRAETLIGLGAVLTDRGRPNEAEPLLREGLVLWLEAVPASHWRVTAARIELAGSLLRKDSPTAAERAEAERLLAQFETAHLHGAGFHWMRSRAAAFR